MLKLLKKNKIIIAILIFASFLRFYKLTTLPVSLFGDELDVGYQAFSLLKTARDYSGNLLPLQPRSLAEWRTPLFIYSTIPSVAIFGITSFGIRLLPALFGILNIYLIFIFLAKLNDQTSYKVLGLRLEIAAALLMAINPWHIQYSRAAFEVTQMLSLLLLGLIFFFNSLENKGKRLWLSVLFITLMPWDYNTPKLFVPLFMLCIFVIYFKKIVSFNKQNLYKAIIVGLLLGMPLLINIFSGQGSQRFSNISLFSDQNLENIISEQRGFDADNGRMFHNKITYFSSRFAKNYLSAFSPDFLFFEGDHNLRHSINNYGEFFAIESITLILGTIFVFGIYENKKVKYLLASWILLAPLPSALTIDGGTHATRLILLLPVLIILNAFGFYALSTLVNKTIGKFVIVMYVFGLIISFLFYQHSLMVHNPKESALWWHYGWKESINYISENSYKYDKIIISTKGEPPWIFYAAYSSLNPIKFQQFSPEDSKLLKNFGQVSSIDNVYFASVPTSSVYEYAHFLDNKTLYMATAEEVSVDLIAEPDRTPGDLNLLFSVAYPSGLPAFYIFSGK